MNKLLTSLAALLFAIVATPNTADASVRLSIGSGYTYISGRASCGCPIYTKRVVRGFDGYRRPIYNYYRQPFKCGCRSHYRAPVVRHGYNSRYISPRYSHGRSSKSSRHSSKSRYVYPSRGRSSNRRR